MTNFIKSTGKYLAIPAFVALALAASPALAGCDQDIENVKAALESAVLSDEDKAKVEAATKAAMEKQAAGDVDGCVAEVTTAKIILQID